MRPIYENLLYIPQDFPDGKILFGIDIGGSLTKFTFLQKNDGKHKKHTLEDRPSMIHMLTFPNGDINGVLEYVRDEIFKGLDGQIIGFGCGIGSMKYKTNIENILRATFNNSDEFASFAKGFHYCKTNLEVEEFLEPYTDPEIAKLPMEGFVPGEHKKFSDSDVKDEPAFPAIMCFIGSGSALIKIEEDGSQKLLKDLCLGGLYYHGLGKLLTGSKSYGDLLSLAKQGKSENINVLLEDIVSENYGGIDASICSSLPYKMEGFPFGKIIRQGIENPKREDLARTLMDDVTMNILFWVIQTAKDHGVHHCYFAGSFLVDNEPFRTYTNTRMPYMSTLTAHFPVLPRIFKFNGYPGALGAVLQSIEDAQKNN